MAEEQLVNMVSQKRLYVGGLCLVMVVSVGANIFQYQKNRRLGRIQADVKEPDETQESVNGAENESIPFEISPGNSHYEELIYQITAAREELSMAEQKIADYESKKAAEKEAEDAEQRRIAEIVEESNEQIKNEINTPEYKNRQIAQIKVQYAGLFKKLGLSSKGYEKFAELLAEEQIAIGNIFYNAQGNSLSKEQQNELIRLSEEYEMEKATALGEEKNEIYLYYMETQTERMKADEFNLSLGTDSKLTDDQEEALIKIMHETEYEEVEYSGDENEQNNPWFENESRKYDACLKAAENILTDSQIEAFDTYLYDELEKIRTQLQN